MPELHESPSTEKTWDSFAPPGSTRDKEYARIARQLRYLVAVTIAVRDFAWLLRSIPLWINFRQFKRETRQWSSDEVQRAVSDALDSPKMQQTIRDIVSDNVSSAMDEEIKKKKNSEPPTAFPNEAAELEEINRRAVAALNYDSPDPSDIHFLIDELHSARPIARSSAGKALRGVNTHIVGSDYYSQSPASAFIPVTPGKLMETINQPDENAADIAWAFHDMKKLTNWNINPFDVRALTSGVVNTNRYAIRPRHPHLASCPNKGSATAC
jgi:hypothetical protein